MLTLEASKNEMTTRGYLVENYLRRNRPELLTTFLTYQNEALAARELLENSLQDLNPKAEILEVGAGILALSIQLASEGFKLTAVEPVGEGFEGISYLMKLFLDQAKIEKVSFRLVETPIENCLYQEKFDFIFSINVMEHLKDPYSVLLKITKNLKNGAKYRFVCPNYDFPYEPHFQKWIFARKNHSFNLLRLNLETNEMQVSDSLSLLKSLNYITLRKIARFARNNDIQITANKKTFFALLSRAGSDVILRNRHQGLVPLLRLLVFFKFHYLARIVPATLQPTMDVEAFLYN